MFALEHGMLFCECSAKTKEGIQKAMEDIAIAILHAKGSEKEKQDANLALNEEDDLRVVDNKPGCQC